NTQLKQTPKPVTFKNYVGYALGDLGGCMTFAILGSFLTPYYLEVAGMGAADVAMMYILIKIWDAINDPLMGVLLDKAFARSRNKHGKFRPWMMRSAPLLLLSSILMFTAPTFTDGALRTLVAYVTYLLYEASYTMFNIPYGSLLAAMANTDEERSKFSSARGFGATVGNLLPLFFFPLILDYFANNQAMGYTLGVTICAVIGFIACILSIMWTRERNLESLPKDKEAEEAEVNDIKFTDILHVFRKNRAFVAMCIVGIAFCIQQYVVTTLQIYMFRDVLGALTLMSIAIVLSMGINFILMAIIPSFSTKFGLERTVRITQLISMILFIVTFLLPTSPYVFLIASSLASGIGGTTVLMQWGMMGEVIDYNEVVVGKRTEGSIYGTFNLTRRIGQAIGSSAAVALLPVIGFIPNAVSQTATALTGIKGLITFIPAICMFICWFSIKFIWNITAEDKKRIAELKN
ncbi:MAG: MFS transporter, partial [Clostridiales bacterium]|nr:MFS transporter [Clostridiales bacterium]